MSKRKQQTQRRAGIKQMKLIAMKQECYALSGAATTPELKQKYPTLAKQRDFRLRKTWAYMLKRLREDGEWLHIKVSDLEALSAEKQRKRLGRKQLVFSPERVMMDKAAENDD